MTTQTSPLSVRESVIKIYNDQLSRDAVDFECIFRALAECGERTPQELHQAYFHLLHYIDGPVNMDLVNAYQRYCGKDMNLTVAPALREPKAAPAPAPAPKQAAPRNQIIADIATTLNIKIPQIKKADQLADNAAYLQHLQYWLTAGLQTRKAANAWLKSDGVGSFDSIKNDIPANLITQLQKEVI